MGRINAMTFDWPRKRLGGLGMALAMFYAAGRYSEESKALTRILADRVREILPVDEYNVGVEGLALRVDKTPAYMGGMTCTPAIGLVVPGDNDTKLRRACELAAEALRADVGDGGEPHVTVTPDTIMISWDAANESAAQVRLAPIARAEIGM
jgi:hypothetical protein